MESDEPKPVIRFEIYDFPEFNLFTSEFVKLHKTHYDSFMGSLARSYELIELYEILSRDANYASNPSLKDIIRASVVLAHGTLEEFLRQLGIKLLLESNDVASRLKDIPLSNEKNQIRAEKFTLGDLERFRGDSIDDILSKSIFDYYQRTTYNNVEDIIIHLRNRDISYDGIKTCLPDIAAMIQRRHEIVHKADTFKKDSTQGNKGVSDITPSDASNWIYAVIILIYGILFSLVSKQMILDGIISEPLKFESENIKVSIMGKRLN